MTKKKKESNKSSQNSSKVSIQHFSKEYILWSISSQKVFNIISHEENVNQNHNEIPLHSLRDNYYEKRDRGGWSGSTRGSQGQRPPGVSALSGGRRVTLLAEEK